MELDFGFLDRIKDSPTFDEPRTVFADWLDDSGIYPELMEFIRLQCFHGVPDTPEARAQASARAAALLATHRTEWLHLFRIPEDLHPYVGFERGMPTMYCTQNGLRIVGANETARESMTREQRPGESALETRLRNSSPRIIFLTTVPAREAAPGVLAASTEATTGAALHHLVVNENSLVVNDNSHPNTHITGTTSLGGLTVTGRIMQLDQSASAETLNVKGGELRLRDYAHAGSVAVLGKALVILQDYASAGTLTVSGGEVELWCETHAGSVAVTGGKVMLWDDAHAGTVAVTGGELYMFQSSSTEHLRVYSGAKRVVIDGGEATRKFSVVDLEGKEHEVDLTQGRRNVCDQILAFVRQGLLPELVFFRYVGLRLDLDALMKAREEAARERASGLGDASAGITDNRQNEKTNPMM